MRTETKKHQFEKVVNGEDVTYKDRHEDIYFRVKESNFLNLNQIEFCEIEKEKKLSILEEVKEKLLISDLMEGELEKTIANIRTKLDQEKKVHGQQFEALMEAIEENASERGYKTILIGAPIDNNDLLSLGYEWLSQKNCYMKNIEGDNFDKIDKILEWIKRIGEGGIPTKAAAKISLSENSLLFKYLTKSFEVKITFKQGRMLVDDSEEFQDVERLQTLIFERLEKVEKEYQLRFLFDNRYTPSFKQLMSSYCHSDDEPLKKIFNKLTDKLSVIEIENESALMLKNRTGFKNVEYLAYKIVKVFHLYVILHKKGMEAIVYSPEEATDYVTNKVIESVKASKGTLLNEISEL